MPTDAPEPGDSTPLVSVIVACRNEAAYIERCLESLLQGTYPAERLEVLVVDGLSADGTREIVSSVQKNSSSPVRLIDNPRKITPAAFNLGIDNSRGDLILIASAHAVYDSDFILNAVKAMAEYDADCVGGVLETVMRAEGPFSEAILLTLSSPIGVGNSKFRTGVSVPTWVDALPYGCFRRSLFQRVGRYNEELARSQDIDFWGRVRRSGGRILLHPSIRTKYVARSRLGETIRYNFGNGFWVTWPMRLAGTRFAWRHLAPLAFVLLVCSSFALGFAWEPIWLLTGVTLVTYLVSTLLVSTGSALQRRRPLLILTGPIAFAALHFSYGFGSAWGLIKPMSSRRRESARARSESARERDDD